MENKDIRRANMLLLAAQMGSIKALAEAIGTAPNYLSQIKNQRDERGMGDALARQIETRLNLPNGWMDALQTDASSSGANAVAIRGSVPEISWTTAGRLADVSDNLRPGDAIRRIPTTKPLGPNAFALKIVGNSMEPKIPNGSTVIIDPARQWQSGSLVLAKRTNDQQATIKQLMNVGTTPILMPLNRDEHEPIEVTPDTRIIGVVVQVIIDL